MMCDDEVKVVVEAARQSVGAKWSTVVAKRMGGGTTNSVWLASDSAASASVVVRIFGANTAELIDRSREVAVAEALSGTGRVPRVLLRFPLGMVTEFAPGRTLRADELPNPRVRAAVAAEMARWHSSEVGASSAAALGPRKALLWPLLSSWIGSCRALVGAPGGFVCDFDEVSREAAFLEDVLPRASPSGLVPLVALCHNDVQALNIIADDDASGRFTFIDLEYSGWNMPYFDIGNHFCEYGGLDCDYSLFPSDAQQLDFIATYLRTLAEVSGAPAPRTEDVEAERGVAVLYSLASHLLWGCWGLFMATKKPSPDFDYVSYSRKRFAAYDEFKVRFNICGDGRGASRPLASCIEQ